MHVSIVRRFRSAAGNSQEKEELPITPSFDEHAARPSAEIATAAKAGQRMPTGAARDSQSQQQALKQIAGRPQNEHEELAAMLLELQTNRGLLDGLTRWYGLFVFTGGDVPTAPWNLAATTSHLEHPLAADYLLTAELQRYRHLIQTVGELGQSGVRPRTLRCRYEMGHNFRQAASEMWILTDALESSVMKALQESPSRSE